MIRQYVVWRSASDAIRYQLKNVTTGIMIARSLPPFNVVTLLTI
jgi:hypothetical protein